ncbi:MAG: ABC transporter ATP-binding protein [Chloroflexi bacterium]|nr:ABC transporter ATP-binding protein [Chloroflexota bacterium]
MSADVIIRVEGVTKVYTMGEEKVHALRGITLDIVRGTYVSIMGPSGSGKSTLFNMIGGLDRPSDGEVIMEGFRFGELSSGQMAWIRCHKVGFIFQSFNLIPSMTALDNVAIARIFSGLTPAQARRDAAGSLEQVGLGNRMDHLPSELSGGQQQRVAIARAIVNRPEVILADEPTGNLDLRTGEDIINLLGKMKMDLNITVIFVTHERDIAYHTRRIIRLRDGRVVADEPVPDGLFLEAERTLAAAAAAKAAPAQPNGGRSLGAPSADARRAAVAP